MLDVKCRSCCEVFVETTEKFDPTRIANGTMLRLKEKYGPSGLNWNVFPNDEWVAGGALECPGCGTPYPDADGFINDLVDADAYRAIMDGIAAAREAEKAADPSFDYLGEQPFDMEAQGEVVLEAPPEPEKPLPMGGLQVKARDAEKYKQTAWCCAECGKMFDNGRAYSGHMRWHEKADRKIRPHERSERAELDTTVEPDEPSAGRP